ncbi:MAG: 4-(cytidine 5'-diphospho)-2-C-methyl-D-erythritol kinase [Alphaproteobacteria bacterium]
MTTVSVQAPAKVNLYLHVTGRRDDGYHLLDSLFVFAKDGDVVTVRESDSLSLDICGPYAGALPGGEENIVLKAARLLAGVCGRKPSEAITLEKNLPVAAGIGGGSADAAAVLKALLKLWNKTIPATQLQEIALKLGADVPSCLAAKAVQVSGIGEILTPAPELPALFLALVNPNRPVLTPAVFKARQPVFSDPAPFTEKMTDFTAFIEALTERKNDLSDAACQIEPAVFEVLQALQADPLCRLARMSGSGGTCFGIFASAEEASLCCQRIRENHPDWWVLNTRI